MQRLDALLCDPSTLGLVSLAFAAVAVSVSYRSARRAATVDPIVALASE